MTFISGVLAFVGVAALLVGVVFVFLPRRMSRRNALLLAAGGFVAMIVSGAILPEEVRLERERAEAQRREERERVEAQRREERQSQQAAADAERTKRSRKRQRRQWSKQTRPRVASEESGQPCRKRSGSRIGEV